MLRFMIRRALSLIPTIFLIITFSFIIIRVAPGGPFASEKQLPPEILAHVQKRYHLDESVPRQYVRYLGDFVRGDLGPSFRYKDFSVNELIGYALPPSMLIGALALLLSVVVGIGAGVISALRQNSWIDYGAMSLAVIGISVPLFVIGPVLKLGLALDHHWLPTSGWLGGRSGWLVLVMPVLTLALPYMAGIARLTRASVLEVLRADYIRTARAKGLSELGGGAEARAQGRPAAGGVLPRPGLRPASSPAPWWWRPSSPSPAWAGCPSRPPSTATIP
jgi:oligopeptide transport system permease protein